MLHVQLFDKFYGHWHGPEGGPFLPVQSAVSSHPIGPIEVTEISVLGHIRSQQAGQFFEPTAMLVTLSEIRQFIRIPVQIEQLRGLHTVHVAFNQFPVVVGSERSMDVRIRVIFIICFQNPSSVAIVLGRL